MTRRILNVVVVLFLLAAARPALGVVEAKKPVSDIYETSKAVMLGTITKIKQEIGAVEVNVTKTLKGEGFKGVFRLSIKIEGLAAQLAVDQPVVLMVSENNPDQGVLHLGDMWVIGDVAK